MAMFEGVEVRERNDAARRSASQVRGDATTAEREQTVQMMLKSLSLLSECMSYS